MYLEGNYNYENLCIFLDINSDDDDDDDDDEEEEDEEEEESDYNDN